MLSASFCFQISICMWKTGCVPVSFLLICLENKRPQVRVGSAGGTLAQTLYFQGHINNVSYTWGILLTSAKVVIQVCLFGRHLFFKHKTRPHLSYWKCRHRSWGTEEEIGNVDLLKNWTLLCGSYWLQHVYTVSIQIFEFFFKKVSWIWLCKHLSNTIKLGYK